MATVSQTESKRHTATKLIDSLIKDTCIQGIDAIRKHDLTWLLACRTIVHPTYVALVKRYCTAAWGARSLVIDSPITGTKLCTRKKKTVNGVKRFPKRIRIFLLLRISSDSSDPIARFNVRLVKFKHPPIVVVRRRRSFRSWRLRRTFHRIPTIFSSTDEDKSYGMNLTRGPSRSKAKATIKFNHRARSVI